MTAGRFATGDDHRDVGVVVPAGEAEVRQRPDAGLPQAGGDLDVAGNGDLRGAPRLRGRDPHQIAALVGQGEEQQAMSLVLPAAIRGASKNAVTSRKRR